MTACLGHSPHRPDVLLSERAVGGEPYATENQAVAKQRQQDKAEFCEGALFKLAPDSGARRSAGDTEAVSGQLASLIVQGPRQGETFADRLSK